MQRTSLSMGEDRFRTRAWEQANIHAARLGEADLARDLNSKKMENGPFRFPAFWPATIDWAPDHNWGGSGMIGLQEMLMQVAGDRILLLPAWPAGWDVDFKMHAPRETTVEARAESGRMTFLKVTPEQRQDDAVLMNTDIPRRQ